MKEGAEMIVIYTTFPTKADAEKVGTDLVAENLAACINIFPGMVSIYRWEGAIETADETVMLVKSRKSLKNRVFEAIAARHPYSVPALIAFEPSDISTGYMEWLHNQTVSHGIL